MKLILVHPDGKETFFEQAWSINTHGDHTCVRTYYFERKELITHEGKLHVEEHIHFSDEVIEWTFSYPMSVRYGFFSRYLGFVKKARGTGARRADKNICFKLFPAQEVLEAENMGIQKYDWMTEEELYDDLPF